MRHLDQTEAVAVLCDELVRLGSAGAAISPGSRSTPITLALAADDRIPTWPIVDERSASFLALGVAKATRRPALVVTTSGTAVAELAPAIHEAREARVPLIALTADRPAELRGIGEGQTIDQVRIFGTAASYFEPDPAAGQTEDWWRSIALEIFEAAVDGRPGPVQVNLALREPLDAVPPPVRADSRDTDRATHSGVPTPDDEAAARIGTAKRAVIIAGRDESGEGAEVAEQAQRLGIPLLADPLSGALVGDAAIASWDALLRVPHWASEHRPDLVLRTGDMPTSKPLRSWLAEVAAEGCEVVQFDVEMAWRDPTSSTGRRADGLLSAALATLPAATTGSDWLASWKSASDLAAAALSRVLDSYGGIPEPAVALTVDETIDAGRILFVAASMPIRDLETLARPRQPGIRVMSNRGANGIDGTIATAVGISVATGQPVTLLLGDIAFLHDHSSLALVRDLQPDLTILVIDNDGGGIFEFLPIRDSAGALFEPFFATPSAVPVAALCNAWGIQFSNCGSLAELRGMLATEGAPGPRVLRVETDRAMNPELHGRMWAAVSKAI